MPHHDDPIDRNDETRDQILWGALQGFVDFVGMRRGELLITVHENRLATFEMLPRLKICFESSSKSYERLLENPISQWRIQEFVQTRLKQPVLECVRRFSSITAGVDGGKVVYVNVTHKQRRPTNGAA